MIRQKREYADAKHDKHASQQARKQSTRMQKHTNHAHTSTSNTGARQAREHTKQTI